MFPIAACPLAASEFFAQEVQLLEIVQKTFGLLTKHDQRRGQLVCLAVVLAAVLEAVGVATVMPFLAVMTSPESSRTFRVVGALYRWLDQPTPMAFTIYFGCFCIGILALSAVSSLYTRQMLLQFSALRYHDLSRRLFECYLTRGYEFFLQHNAAKLGDTVIADCEEAITRVLLGLMIVFSNLAVVVCLFLAAILIQPVLAMTAFMIVGGLYLMTYGIIRRRIVSISHRHKALAKEHVSIVSQAFAGIKEVKVFGVERFFIDRYDRCSHDKAEAAAQALCLAELPRKVIESIVIVGALAIILAVSLFVNEPQNAVPVIAFFTFTAYKLLPCVQQIYQHWVKIRFSAPAVIHIHEELHPGGQSVDVANPSAGSPLQPSTPALRDLVLDRVSLQYPGAERAALTNISLRIPAGAVVAFVGESGSGKTSTVGVLLGLLQPTSGRVLVDSEVLNETNVRTWQSRIGFVPQHIALLDDSIALNIAFGDKTPDPARLELAASQASIDDLIRDRLPARYETQVGDNGMRLSGGERQRIGIARALYRDPEVLVLDEATSALDSTTEASVMDSILSSERQRTIIMIAHRLNTIRRCDWVCYFEQGRLIGVGTFDELTASCAGFAGLVQASSKAEKTLVPSPSDTKLDEQF